MGRRKEGRQEEQAVQKQVLMAEQKNQAEENRTKLGEMVLERIELAEEREREEWEM